MLTHLKETADKNKYFYEGKNSELLEYFEKEKIKDQKCLVVDIVAPEFTCLCPLTGQPDYAVIKIEYVPDTKYIESKSLKLYLGSFRNEGTFHEECIKTILDDLVEKIEPIRMTVKGEFTPRGGIKFWPTMAYIKRG